MTDREAVSEFLKNRNEQIFREIYRRHTPALYMLAVRLTGGMESDAQDAVQETWIRVCRKLQDFKWNSKLRTWITGILINCIREIQKDFSKRCEEELTDSLTFNKKNNADSSFDLERIINNLPAGYRRVLVLHDVEGYTHEEISEFLKISVGTSKSQLFQARKSIRMSLRKE